MIVQQTFMSMKKSIFHAVSILALLAGCGFVDDGSSEQDVYENVKVTDQCLIQVEDFKNFTKTDIENKIRCIQANFDSFTKFVKTSHQNEINKKDLELFLKRFFRNNSETLIDGLQLLFKINTLLLYESADSITNQNIKELINLFVLSNKQAIIITNLFKNITKTKSKKEFWSLRDEIKKTIEIFIDTTQTILSDHNKMPQMINLVDFLKSIKQRFKLIEFDDAIIDQITFVKKIFIGGRKDILTSSEFFYFLKNSSDIIMLGFDFFLSDEKNFDSKSEFMDFYAERLSNLEQYLSHASNETILFQHKDLMSIIKNTFTSSQDVKDIEQLILLGKENLLRGPKYSYNYKDTKNMFLFLKMAINLSFTKSQITTNLREANTPLRAKEKIFENQVKDYIQKTKKLLQDGSSNFPSSVNFQDFLTHASKVKLFASAAHINFDQQYLNSMYEIFHLVIGRSPKNLSLPDLYQTLEKLPAASKFYFEIKHVIPTILNHHEKKDKLVAVIDMLEEMVETDGKKSDFKIISLPSVKYIISKYISPILKIKDQTIQRLFKSFSDNVLFNMKNGLDRQDFFTSLDYSKYYAKAYNFKKFHDETLTALTPDNFRQLKKQYLSEVKKLAAYIKSQIITRNDLSTDIYYLNFLTDLSEMLPKLPLNIDMIEHLSVLKSLMLGGNKKSVSPRQIIEFLDKAENLAGLYFDLSLDKAVSKDLLHEKSLTKNLSVTRSVLQLIHDKTNNDIIIENSDILNLISFFTKSKDFDEFLPLIDIIKTKYIGGEKGRYSPLHLVKILEVIETFFEDILFKKIAYREYYEIMQTKEHINFRINIKYNRNFSMIRRENFAALTDDFNHIIKNYHFYRNKFKGDQFYSNKYIRTEYGLIEISTLRFLTDIILKSFGHLNTKNSNHAQAAYSQATNHAPLRRSSGSENNVSRLNLSHKELDFVLKSFKPLLVRYKLWSKRIATFAQNTLLLGDLFQYQSNGNGILNQDELAEYGGLIISAVSLAQRTLKTMVKNEYCQGEIIDDDYAIMPSCFKQHFFHIFLNVLKQKKYFPKLNKYIINSSKIENNSKNFQSVYKQKLQDNLAFELNFKQYLPQVIQDTDFPDINIFYNYDNIYFKMLSNSNLLINTPAYFKEKNISEAQTFLKSVLFFARETPGEQNPINKRDTTLLIGALLNIESTFLRYDRNNDNIIDEIELDEAFINYRSSIIKMVKLPPKNYKYAKSIFFYMVKFMQLPPKKTIFGVEIEYGIGSFHFNYFKNPFYSKKIRAKRINVGAVLSYIVNHQRKKVEAVIEE